MPTRSRPRHLNCDRCYYCEMYLAHRHEHDHFPIQWTYGGEGYVPVCINCHDLKDRIPLNNWPLIGAFAGLEEVLEELIPLAKRDGRFPDDALPDEYPHWLSPYLRWDAIRTNWIAFSPIARVLIAKLMVIEQMGRQSAWQQWTPAVNETSEPT